MTAVTNIGYDDGHHHMMMMMMVLTMMMIIIILVISMMTKVANDDQFMTNFDERDIIYGNDCIENVFISNGCSADLSPQPTIHYKYMNINIYKHRVKICMDSYIRAGGKAWTEKVSERCFMNISTIMYEECMTML